MNFSWVKAFIALASASTVISSSSNPYTSGCLQHSLPGWSKKRVCNSNDPPGAAIAGLCREPDMPHLEIRIYVFNWDTAYFNGFLLQILLSEVLDVPVTLETGDPNAQVNMYDPLGRFEFGSTSDATTTASIRNAAKYGQECTLASRDAETYEPCAHHFPEIWNYNQGQEGWAQTGVAENLIEFPYSLGMVAQEGIFTTKHTVQKEPSVFSYFGMTGEANRRKMAELFPHPFSWGDYCMNVSPNNCTSADGVAKRAPISEEESKRFFMEGQFTGHFQHTDQNDCDENPSTCNGHIAPYPCGWSSNAEALMYHNNIALKGGGKDPEMPHGGYSYGQLVDLMLAANATGSNLILEWWTPNQQVEMFRGSDIALVKVAFPYPSQECFMNRPSVDDICSPHQAIRVGTSLGACDDAPKALLQTVTSGLHEVIQQVDEAIQSPAYAALKRFLINEFQLSEIFQLQRNGSATPRDAVCDWAVTNFDNFLLPLLPPSHPRTLQDSTRPILNWTCGLLGLITCGVVFAAAFGVYRQRKRRVIRYAQIEFLWILLFGGLTLAIGAIVVAIPPSNGTCIASVWLVGVGYTLILVPLIIKVAAINQLNQASRNLKRVTINRTSLLGVTALVSASILVYLAVWSAIDAPRKRGEYELTDVTMTPEASGTDSSDSASSTVVNVSYYCSPNSQIWNFVLVAWNGLLLICCTVLAVQTRKVRQEFNESQVLGLVIYGHFVISLLLLITNFLSSVFSASTLTKIQSILYSIDTLTTIIIYFVPKLFAETAFFRRTLSVTRYVHNPLHAPGRPIAAQHSASDGQAISIQSQISQVSDLGGSLCGLISTASGNKEEGALASGIDEENKEGIEFRINSGRQAIDQVLSEKRVSEESERMLIAFLFDLETLTKDYSSLKQVVKSA